MSAEESILPHICKRLIIVVPLKEDLISNLLNKPFFGSSRDVSGRNLIASNRHGHPPKILFLKE